LNKRFALLVWLNESLNRAETKVFVQQGCDVGAINTISDIFSLAAAMRGTHFFKNRQYSARFVAFQSFICLSVTIRF